MFAENTSREVRLTLILCFLTILLPLAGSTPAQNVTTQHYDIARTGANTGETVLTPSNVNTNNFGKLFYYIVDGYAYAQPLFMSGVTMGPGTPQAGTTHNVVYVATEHDSVYAFDADGNLGANARPLWQITLLDSAHGAAPGATPVPSSDVGSTDLVPEIGITSTPVIDAATKTIYIVGKTKENGTYVHRLHALDIRTGAEKFGGPVALSGAVPGNGTGSLGGTLSFDPKWQLQRPGLLLLNGIVYIGSGAHGDTGPWHGWILGYNAATLRPTGVWCSSPNGLGNGIWLSGAGLTADVPDPILHPYGRLFTATGTGTFSAAVPYSNAMDYSVSVLRLDLANGVPTMNSNGITVGDMFAPFNQASLSASNKDQGSGGALMLPDAVSGGKHLFVQVGKSGRIYIFDRDNLGGYHPNNTSDPQQKASVNGEVFGAPAYWNGNVYVWAGTDRLKAFSFANGVLSGAPTSSSAETSQFPGPTPAVSANGTTNGIVWSVRTDAFDSQGPEVLHAHDANNVATLLYSSQQNTTRDNPGNAVKFVVPTIVNGKVYVGAEYQISVYGLLNGATQAAAPVIRPGGQLFNSPLQVTITESSPNAQIFYTTDGSTPTTASAVYAGPITVTNTQTIKAMAAGNGYLASVVTSETYTFVNQVPTPTFNPIPGNYNSTQSVTITTTWAGSTIYYTTDGSTPTTSSSQYTTPVSIGATATLRAIATAPNLSNSAVASGLYTIVQNAVSSINFSNGFTSGGMALVGGAQLSGTRLRLTDGGAGEATAAWYPTPVNVQAFSTDFSFQQTPGTNPIADGFTFAIQGNDASVVGPSGGGLGYGATSPGGTPGIAKSVAVKFDLFSNAGEGNSSTGLYANGASPTVPATTFGGGIDLQSGHIFAIHMTYDGITLTMTITDTANTSNTFTLSWPINIPSTVSGNTAYVGFTGGTGHYTAVQDILSWTYVTSPQAAAPVISPATGTYSSAQTVTITDSTSGSTIYYTLDGSQPTTSSTKYTGSFPVSTTTTVKAIATAPNFLTSTTATSVITIQTGGVALTPGSLAFPVTQQGSTSAAQTVTLTSSGTATLHVSSVVLGGANPGDFSMTNGCSGAYAVNTSCTISVTFSPIALGSRAATITITDDAPDSPQSIPLSGSGAAPAPKPGLTIAPSSVSFGNVTLGTNSQPQGITITSSGTATLHISSVVLGGINASEFSMTNGCSGAYAVNTSCTISVTFSPIALGSRAATITITDDAPDSPQSIPLSGTGAAPAPKPGLTIAPSSVSFGNVTLGTNSQPQSITLTSSGTATLHISSVVLGGINASEFSMTNGCSGAYAVNTSCTISVTFSPIALGSRAAAITITDDAPNSPQSIPLSGTGAASTTKPGLTVTPSSASYGSVAQGTTSAPQNFTVTSSGTAMVHISSVVLGGANPGDFAMTNGCNGAYGVNTSCTISVTFSPIALGSRAATITITDDAPNSPQSILLSGTGAPPPNAGMTVAPSSVSFGSVTQGTTSKAQIVTLTSSGSATLHISSVVLGGTNAGEFTVANGCNGAYTVNAGCTISLAFSPLATGPHAATVTITDDAAGSPHTIVVSGDANPAFTIAPVGAGGTSVAVTAGQTASFNLQLTPGTGYLGNVSFACTGAPATATCTAAPLQVSGANPVPFTVSVATTANGIALPFSSRPPSQPFASIRIRSLLSLCVVSLLICSFYGRTGSTTRRRQLAWSGALIVLALGTVVQLSGCSSLSSPTSGVASHGTPSGTSTIVLTPAATSANGKQLAAIPGVQLTLTVK